MKPYYPIKFISILFFCFINIGAFSQLTGTTAVTVGQSYSYSYTAGSTVTSPVWSANNGTVGTKSGGGIHFSANVTWNSVGNGQVFFYNGSTLLATLNVTISAGIPSTPTATSASSITSSSFTANWGAVSGVTGYRLDVSTASDFSSFVSGYNNFATSTSAYYNVTGLTDGTNYYYRVRAANAAGTSGNSGTISLRTTTNAISGPTSVTTGQTYTYSYLAGGVVSSPTWIPTGGGATVVSTSNTGLNYTANIKWNGSGSAAATFYSGTTNVLASLAVTITDPVPAVPSVGSASSITQNSFSFSWGAPAYATKYFVDVSTTPFSSPTYVSGYNNLQVSSTSLTVSNLTDGTVYYYQVRAGNGTGTSASSSVNVATTTTNPVTGPTSVTTGQTYTYSYLAGGVVSSPTWIPTGGAATVVSTSNTGLNYTANIKWNGSGSASATFYSGTTVVLGSLAVTIIDPVPAVPVVGSASSITQNSFSFSWGAPAYATKYFVDVSTTPFASPTYVAGYNNLQVSSTSLTVTGLTDGTVYYYQVRAGNGTGTSASSSVNVTTTTTNPVTGTTSATTGQTYTYSYLAGGVVSSPTWIPTGGAATVVSTSNTGLYYTANIKWNGSGSASATFYSGTTVVLGSLAVTIIDPVPAVPVVGSASSITQTSFSFSWGAPTYATKYFVDVSTTPFSSPTYVSGYNNLQVTSANFTVSLTVTGLTDGTVYYYQVRAGNLTGTSASSTANVTTTATNPVTGPNPATVGVSYSTYAYLAGGVVTSPTWIPINGTVTATSNTGLLYKATITWNSIGHGSADFYSGTTNKLGSLPVTIVPAAPSVTNNSGCGTVRLNATPASGATQVWWYTALTNGTHFAQGNYYDATSTVTYYVTSYDATNGETAERTPITATVTQPPTVAPSVLGNSRFGAGILTLTASGAPAGLSYQWYNPSGQSVGSNPTYPTPYLSASASNYVYATVNNGCDGPKTWVSINVYNVPVITGNHNVVNGTPVVLDAGAGYDTYSWTNSAGAVVSTSEIFSTSVKDTYIVTVTKNSLTSPPSASFVVGGQLYGQNQNYIVTNTVTVDNILTSPSVDNLLFDSKLQAIQYFDGLGRPMQSVATQASPSRTDIVSPIIYDTYGRESKKYLPFTSGGSGWYKNDPAGAISGNYTTSAQYAFYNNIYDNGVTDNIADDTRPFNETFFEPSPLNRALKDYGPGLGWNNTNVVPTPTTIYDKPVIHAYLVSVNPTTAGLEQIIAWTLDVNNMPVRAGTSGTTTNGSYQYYNVSQLSIKSTTDEQGHEVREYVDKIGHTILKKVQAIASPTLTDVNSYAQTYYIYDNLGLLRYVLQPELVKKLVQNTSNPSATDLASLAFQYQYDSRNRMTQKQVPGAGPVYMVYDKRDRLVLTQDANQRAGVTNAIKYWTFTKYDLLNRPIMTGIRDTTTTTQLTQAQMQAAVDAHFAKPSATWGEVYVGSVAGNVHGYSNKAYPVRTGSVANEIDPNKYLTVTYYDNYSFRSLWYGTYTYLNESLSGTGNSIVYNQPSTENQNVVGNVTGSKTKVLDGGTTGGYTWLKNVTYYDDKYRVIQTLADNYKGGTDRATNVVDFVGKILKSKTTHVEQDVTWTNFVSAAITGNKILSTYAAGGWGNSGASSMQQLAAGQDGWLEVIASETNLYRMIGLSSSDPNANYSSIAYAWYQINNGTLGIYENGANRGAFGAYSPGDVLRIERTGTTVKYFQNSVLKYTSTIASSTLLMADAALYNLNTTVVGVRTSFSTTSHTITRHFDYDPAGRLTNTWHQIDTGPDILLTNNQYNEIGQLVDKKLHSTNSTATDAKQSVDYRYNIRGWLTSMNNSQLANDGTTNDDTGDLFGINLAYESSDANLGSTGFFNGNISGMKWSVGLGIGDMKELGYNFSYDPMNRLLAANSRMNKTSVWQAGYYDENGLAYDLNGNIQTLQRKGDNNLQIDNLTYNYGATGGNQLQYVQDNTINTTDKLKGFTDGNAGTATDYTYDVNGNMTHDLNKGIGATIADVSNIIKYNFLNLPETVTKAGNTVQYVYDATGRKIAQVVNNQNTQKQTDYVGEFIYENDVLQFINHEEGRITLGATKLIYTNSFNSVSTDISAINTTTATYSSNGENYVKAMPTTTTAGNGLFPIGGTFTVQAGDRYRVRVKGYRSTNPVYLQVKAGTTVLNSPGTALPNSTATESWVEQIVTIPAGVTTMQAGMVWGTTLTTAESFYLNEMEISQLTINATPEYQYHLKDHLGNVRLTFTTKPQTPTSYIAHFENPSSETSSFSNYQTSSAYISTVAANATSPSNSYHLNGGYAGIVGLTKTFSVMPGDAVSITSNVKYTAPNGTASNVGANIVSALLTAFSVPTGSVAETGLMKYGNWDNGTIPISALGTGDEQRSDNIKAFVTIILFDRSYNLLDVTYQSVQTNGSMSANYIVKQPGYAYIYFSNEHPYQTDMYFDDVTMTFTPSAVVQMEDFYPFGLTFNSYARENTMPQNYLYSGKEQTNDLSLGIYDYGARMYDPSVGRFGVVDKYASHFAKYSPYSYATNSPILFKDRDGYYPVNIVNASGILTESFIHLINISTGISYRTLSNTFVTYDKDSWLHPHRNFTGYGSGGITLNSNIILTNDFDTKGGSLLQTRSDVEKWFGLVPHELGHRVQKDAKLLNSAYLISYGIQSILTAIGKGSVDQNIVHDEIPMEAEANQYQEKFNEFLNFFNYKDKKGNDRNKIIDLFSGGKKDDNFIMAKLDEYKDEYDKAKEEESKKKSNGVTSMLNNFSSLQEGTYTWDGSSWIRK